MLGGIDGINLPPHESPVYLPLKACLNAAVKEFSLPNVGKQIWGACVRLFTEQHGIAICLRIIFDDEFVVWIAHDEPRRFELIEDSLNLGHRIE